MTLSFAFLDLGTRVIIQFVCTTLLVKSLSKSEFAELSFTIVVFSYFATVINAAFDSLINKKLSEGDEGFYSYSLTLKFAGYILCCFLTVSFLAINWFVVLSIAASIALGVYSEHQDVRLRYNGNYKPYKYRLLNSFLLSPLKLYFCAQGDVECYLLIGVLDAFFVILINSQYTRTLFACSGLVALVKKEGRQITKTFLAGLSIFTFFRLDQFFVYGVLGRLDYSYYSLAVRFNELVNSSVGIVSRYYLPQVFLKNNHYRHAMVRLFFAQLFFSFFAGLGLFLYLKFWASEYLESWSVYLILCGSGFFLIFGQLRGIFFVKSNFYMPDTYNAILGILVFSITLYFLPSVSAQYVAIAYCLGFFVSGVVSTVLYRAGFDFLKSLRSKNG